MIIDPTIKFLGPVAVLSTSGTLDLFSRENGLADFSILLSALLPESEPASFSLLSSSPSTWAVRIAPLKDILEGMGTEEDFYLRRVPDDTTTIRNELRRLLRLTRDPGVEITSPELHYLRGLKQSCHQFAEHEYFNRPLTVIAAISTEDPDSVGTVLSLLNGTIEILKDKYGTSRDTVRIMVILVAIPSSQTPHPGSASETFKLLKEKFGTSYTYYLDMSKVVFFSDSPGRELPRTRKVYLLNKDVEHLLTPSRSSFEEGEKGSGVVLPTENLLEAVETFVQKTLVQIVVKNLELVAHNKSPDLSTSSSWSSALIQRAKLKYLKTSKLADFFSSEKQQSSDTGESQKLRRSVVMLKELADMVFMLGNFNIAYRLYTILHERLLKEPAFVLYMAGAREMLGLCALALDKTDSIKTAIRHLGFCLEVYNDLERSDLSSTALFRYHEVLENTLGETPLFLALVRAAVSHKGGPVPISYGLVLERCFWKMNYGREDRNLFKGVLYIYLAAMCYYKRSMYHLAYKCYTLASFNLRSRDYPQMFSGVYRYLGNCARHLGSYTEALEGYAQASMLDHSDYHHLLSDYSSTLEQFYGENVKREDIIFPRLAAPRVLDDTVTVKMFPLSNFGSSEGLFIRKIIRSRAGSSGAISELSCSINDTVMIHFDIYNELSIPVTFSCFKFTAVFEDVDGGKSPFESLAAGDATLYPGEIKPCSAKTVFKITGRLKITGYRFKIDGTEFSSSWSDSSKSEFLNSGAEIKIGTESDGLRVNFENVDAEMAHGEIREVYANVLNISTEDIFVESVDVTGSMFFLGDGAARQSIMGCCINNNCPKHRVLLVEENGIQCRCDHEIYTVSNDIFAYMSDLKKSPGSAKIHAQSFVDLKFSIWASERGIQVYKISFNYRFSSTRQHLESLVYEIFVNSKKQSNVDIHFTGETPNLDHRMLELVLDSYASENYPIKLICFSPSYALDTSFVKSSALNPKGSKLYRISNHEEVNDTYSEIVTWEYAKDYVLQDKAPPLTPTRMNIIVSSISESKDPQGCHFDNKSLLSTVICDHASKMRNYIQNEVYSWLSSDTAEILLKLFYKKDIMLLVAWVDPLTEKYCVHRFVDDSCSSQIMKNMFSYLFKRISDMKFRAEDERLSDVVLKKGQKTLAQQYPLQAKAMGQFPLNVNLLSDTEIAHSFESKSCVLNVVVEIENCYLEKDISFMFAMDMQTDKTSLSTTRNFCWAGSSNICGKLKPYQKERRPFTAIFRSPGTYDINTWILYIYPNVTCEFSDGSLMHIKPDKTYSKVSASPLLVTVTGL